MTLWHWCISNWISWKTIFYPRIPTPGDSKSKSQDADRKPPKEIIGKHLRRKVYEALACDLHDILKETNKIGWPEWHLVVDENDKAVEIARQFHKHLKTLELSSSIIEHIQTIDETFLKFQPIDSTWNNVRQDFKQACEQDDPALFVKCYTREKTFTTCLNKHLAANSYHFFRCYCTILNCPILDQTQQYTEAFTNILFHPKLRKGPIPTGTVYRGIILNDKKLIASYKKGATILTTTFLSTSRDPGVADMYGANVDENSISIFCTYNIKNTHGSSALDIQSLSQFNDENEILILRYVPFTITSINETEDRRKISICLDECSEETPKPTQLESNTSTSTKMDDITITSQPAVLNGTQDRHNASYCRNEEIHLSTISDFITECETDRNRINSRRLILT